MALVDVKSKAARWLSNYDFVVLIDKLDGSEGESQSLPLGVDRVSGLARPKTNVMRFRQSGLSNTSMLPVAGLSTAGTVTMEGCVYVDHSDLLALQRWHQEVQGEVPASNIGGQYRMVTILQVDRDEINNTDLLAAVDTIPASRRFVLQNAICTSLSVSDQDANSEDFSTWTIEIEYETMRVG